MTEHKVQGEIPDHEGILERVRNLDRDPFRSVLANLLGAEPTLEALRTWAEKSPDRWAQAIAIFSKAGGYADKTEVKVEDLREKSDADLEQEARDLLEQLQPGIGHNSSHASEEIDETEPTPINAAKPANDTNHE